MNVTVGQRNITWTGKYVDSNLFMFNANTGRIQVRQAGYCEISFNVYITSTVQRTNPTIRLWINGLPKAANLRKAIFAYAVAHNATWPSADPVNYQMGWCDCHSIGCQRAPDHPDGKCTGDSGYKCYTYGCKEGYFPNAMNVFKYDQSYLVAGGIDSLYCCRPCFKS